MWPCRLEKEIIPILDTVVNIIGHVSWNQAENTGSQVNFLLSLIKTEIKAADRYLLCYSSIPFASIMKSHRLLKSRMIYPVLLSDLSLLVTMIKAPMKTRSTVRQIVFDSQNQFNYRKQHACNPIPSLQLSKGGNGSQWISCKSKSICISHEDHLFH